MNELLVGHPQFATISTEILARGEAVKFKAYGSSMRPFIRDGDILTVRPMEQGHWTVGQIVFYQSKDHKLLAHRIIGKTFTDGIWRLSVRGDAMNAIQEEISEDQVLGEVFHRQRNGKSVQVDRGWWKIAGVAWVVATRFLRRGRNLASRLKNVIRNSYSLGDK